MKNAGFRKLMLLLFVLAFFTACKKDTKKAFISTTTAPPPTIAQAISGKWVITKDSIAAFDHAAPITYSQHLNFSKADYVVFGADSAGSISSQVAFDALYSDYIKTYVNPTESIVPQLNFKFNVTSKDSVLSISQITSTTGIGYNIIKLDDSNLVLFTQAEVEKYPHNYEFKQYISFKKQAN